MDSRKGDYLVALGLPHPGVSVCAATRTQALAPGKKQSSLGIDQ
ncbi:MAG TPA: hypothetical protein VG324_08940 [Blastocatellia bacterium]|nr:hypothetical protein [Blastocatellia bacterium]